MPEPVSGGRRYLPGLDGLRALAVFAVIAYHLNLPQASGGLLGVGLFFVLSGYLITEGLIAQWERSHTIRLGDFWKRRARRLLPALAVLLASVTIYVGLVRPAEWTTVRQAVVAAVFYVSNWWAIFHHVSYFARFGPPSPLDHLWSLAVEEQFYLLWPLVLWAGFKTVRHRGWLTVLVVTMALCSAGWMAWIYHPGADPNRVYYGTDTRAFALLIGAALALIWRSDRLAPLIPLRSRWILDGVGVMSLVVILAMMGRANPYTPSLYRGGLFGFSILSAVLVAVLAHPATRLGRLFGVSPLRWIGARSYGIYLWHYPVIVLTAPFTLNTFHWPLALAQTAASITLAALSWRFLEEPIRRGAARRLWRRLFPAQHRFAWILAPVPLALAGMVVVPALAGNPSPASTSLAMAPEPSQPLSRIPSPSPSVSAHASPTPASPSPTPFNGITAIGDSVLIDAAPDLTQVLPNIHINAQVGRQLFEAEPIVQHLEATQELGRAVVLELGTNGPFTKPEIDSLLKTIGPKRRIVLVNTRVPKPWEKPMNQLIDQAAQTHSNTVLVRWYSASSGHPDYFDPDGVHLTPKGAAAFANLVAGALKP